MVALQTQQGVGRPRSARALDFMSDEDSSLPEDDSPAKEIRDSSARRQDRKAAAQRRRNETAEQKRLRLDRDRAAAVARRLNETAEQRQARLDKVNLAAASRRQVESAEEAQARRQQARERYHAVKREKYLTAEEMRVLSDSVLPGRPSETHQLEIARLAQRFLSATNEHACVVCDTFPRPGEELTIMPIADLPPSADQVLKCPRGLPEELYQQYCVSVFCISTVDRNRVASLLLSPRGVGPATLDSTIVYTCTSCLGSLRETSQKMKGGKRGGALKPPRWAIANGNFVGQMPPDIAALEPTPAELALISPVFKTAQLVIVRAQRQTGGPGQFKLQSHTCSYELDVEKVIKSLPLRPSEVPFRVLISGPRKANTRVHVGRRYNVRRGVVRMLLTHLKKCNPYFEKITVDEDMLDRLPADAMAEDMVHEDTWEEHDQKDEKGTTKVFVVYADYSCRMCVLRFVN
jgi:hypothetical protein